MGSLVIAVFLLLPNPPQPVHATVRVATRVVSPFVIQDGNALRGFSIELWQEIGLRLGLKSEFVVKPTVQDVLQTVKSNDATLGIAAISITAEREEELDLSQPMFDAGLQILTRASQSSGGLFSSIVAGVLSSAALPILAVVIVTILFVAHLVWIFEHRHPRGILSQRSYYPGILEAAWWAASTLATQADQMHGTGANRGRHLDVRQRGVHRVFHRIGDLDTHPETVEKRYQWT
jgi:polar amino acid transport system substrate-binding protein